MSLAQTLQELAARTVHHGGVPGVSIALSVAGESCTAAAGLSDCASGTNLSQHGRFQIGCLTKLLTALLALRLARSGSLDLHAPIDTYLPEYTGTSFAGITARHLASHTSGYEGLNLADPGVAYYYSDDKLQAFSRATPRTFCPGAVFNYEHSESVLLGHIVQRITGRSVAELMREWVFEPLGICCEPATTTEPTARVTEHLTEKLARSYKPLRRVPYGRFWEASLSDLTISPADLVKLGEWLVGTRTCPNWPVDTLSQLYVPVVRIANTAGGPRMERMPVAFGFGCAQYEGGLFGHNGSSRGHTIGLRLEPCSRTAVVVAINTWEPHVRDVVLSQAYDLVGQERSSTGHLEPMDVPPLSDLAGSYVGGTHGVRIEMERTDEEFTCVIRNKYAPSELRVRLAPEAGGRRLVPKSNIGHLSMGFFMDSTGVPCLMLGLNAYRHNGQRA